MDATHDRGPVARTGPPDRIVSANDVVSLNLAYYRKAAGLSQQQLADKVGWLKQVVSAAERSWEGRRTRNFTADDLVELASALGLPVTAFLLPPEDDGVAFRYVLHKPHGDMQPLRDLLPLIVGAVEDESPVMTAYRNRLVSAGTGPLGEPMEEAARVLALALQTADEAIEAARRDGDEVLTRSRGDAEDVLRLAQRYAEQLTGDARARAESLERDAQERHRQAMGSLVMDRERLERRVDELREFEREYRGRLQRFIEGGYRDLWSGVEGVDSDALVRELQTRAEQLGANRYSVVLLGEDGTYDTFTSDDLERADEEADDKGTLPDGWSREAWEQAGGAAQDLRNQGIPGPYMVAGKDGVITVTPAAQTGGEAPEERDDDEGERLPALLLP